MTSNALSIVLRVPVVPFWIKRSSRMKQATTRRFSTVFGFQFCAGYPAPGQSTTQDKTHCVPENCLAEFQVPTRVWLELHLSFGYDLLLLLSNCPSKFWVWIVWVCDHRIQDLGQEVRLQRIKGPGTWQPFVNFHLIVSIGVLAEKSIQRKESERFGPFDPTSWLYKSLCDVVHPSGSLSVPLPLSCPPPNIISGQLRQF